MRNAGGLIGSPFWAAAGSRGEEHEREFATHRNTDASGTRLLGSRLLAGGLLAAAILLGAGALASAASPLRAATGMVPGYVSVGSTLHTGQNLTGGHCLTNDVRAALTFCVEAATGDLVLDAHPGRPLPPTQLWSALGSPGDRLVPQRDGNLVLYAKSGRAIWASNTGRHTAAHLVLQSDANVVLYDSAGPLWATATEGLAGMGSQHPSAMTAGQYLATGSGLVSRNGLYLVYLYRGQLQILPESELWSNGVPPDYPFAVLRMQRDGNLVEYNGRQVLWSTHTYAPGARFVIQDDRNAVVYSPSGKALWASGT